MTEVHLLFAFFWMFGAMAGIGIGAIIWSPHK